MSPIQGWWAAGERIPLELSGAERRVFVRRLGGGPAMTLLHGFPSSSHDYAKIAGPLSADHALLLPDFLGFGASDKPQDHEYSIHEQADLVERLWEREQLTETKLVAHDYAVSVAQELLARRSAGDLAVEITEVSLMNGGIYPDLHRPLPIQTALLDPEQGPVISANLNAELLAPGLKETFAPGFDFEADAAEIAASMARDDGLRIAHRLIRYMADREAHALRWVTALDTTDVPLAFVWGMLDPISGAHVVKRIAQRHPASPLTRLEDVGHWPPLEAPERVVAAISRGAAAP